MVFSFCSMSAIDFYCSVDKIKGVDGKDRVVVTFDGKYLPYTEQVLSAILIFYVTFAFYNEIVHIPTLTSLPPKLVVAA